MSEQNDIPQLWELTYKDINKAIHLSVYADTLAYDTENGRRLLAAVRFGGYPEQVRAMADAIYGGGQVCLSYNGSPFYFQGLARRYRKFFTNDGLYMEATLVLENELQQAENSKKEKAGTKKELWRAVYIYCEKDSDERLFEELDATISVPLIPEFREYILRGLKELNYLTKLDMFSSSAQFDVWKLLYSRV